jgi:ABC-type transport system substrate-binding protein
MKRSITLLVALAALVAFVGVVPATAGHGVTGKVCLVADSGGFDDAGFNAGALAGAQHAARKLHVELDSVAAETNAELPGLVAGFVEGGDCDVIIGIGFRVGDAMAPFVDDNPEQLFSVVDFAFVSDSDNAASVLFRVDEPSFLAGYVAAGISGTGRVGVYGGWDLPAVTLFMDGYALGVEYYNAQYGTDVEVLGWDPDTRSGVFTFDFNDPAAGRAVTHDLFDQGADTVFAVAGLSGEGSLDAAAERKAAGEMVRVIEPDVDWFDAYGDPARVLLTSVLKNTDVAVYHQIEAFVDGTWTAGPVWEDLATDGVGLAKYHQTNNQVPDSIREDLKPIRSGIIDGTIPTVPAFQGLSVEAESCDYGGLLKRITAVDRLTVEFELCEPDVAIPAKVALPAFGIHSQGYLEATGGTGDLITSPIGTGPYAFTSWESEITLEPYDGYWGEHAPAAVAMGWEADPAVRLADLMAGTVDGIDAPDPGDYAAIEADPDLALLFRDPMSIFYIGMNRDHEPFDDERVRQAMAMGVDRQRLIDLFYPEGSLLADQFLPPAMFGYTEEPGWYDHDPVAATALLAEAGYPTGFEVTLTYRVVPRTYLPTPDLVAAEIATQLAAIGVDVTIEEMESGAFLDASDAGEVPFHLLGWIVDWPDPTNMLDFHFGPEASDQFGVGFADIWDVLVAARSTADATLRLDLYQQAAELLKQHAPMIPIAHAADAVAFRSDVAGAHAAPIGGERFAAMDPAGRPGLLFTGVAEPLGLYCGDESDRASLRACVQVNEPLLTYEVGGTRIVPALATDWSTNNDLTLWTFTLRNGVTFHDGSQFDANDVVTTYAMMWDAANPLHVGHTGQFVYFDAAFGLLNQD